MICSGWVFFALLRGHSISLTFLIKKSDPFQHDHERPRFYNLDICVLKFAHISFAYIISFIYLQFNEIIHLVF